MSPPRRLRLRVLGELSSDASAVDALREKLGGRAKESDPSVGALVSVPGHGPARVGVVLFADAAEAHVWVGDGLVRRVARSELSPHDGAVDAPRAAIADSARLFAGLAEGALVAFVAADGAPARGRLVEKHRFGALVEVDGKVLAIGFRRFAQSGAAFATALPRLRKRACEPVV